jgi:ABC-type transport system involved in multi-copper enzyme maturation permease subunit
MQTIALLIDSWRLLTSRKLFWLTLAINLFVVILYGSIALTETGVSLGYGLFQIESERFRAGSIMARSVLMPFINVQIIAFWLAWAATGLGLISTASIFPDFLADGAIDMVLAKPLSRLKAFVVKYVGALLFVLMQVTVFCVASLFISRLRLGEWEWMLLAAIPVVTVFFSYIYAVSALVGVLTRSSIAAILAAGVFWFAVFLIQTVEAGLLQVTTFTDAVVSARGEVVSKREAELAVLAAKGLTRDDNEFERLRGRLENDKKEYEKEASTAATAKAWHDGLYIATMIIPKTSATIGLIDRWFAKDVGVSSLTELLITDGDRGRRRGPPPPDFGEDEEIGRGLGAASETRSKQIVAERPIWWVIGTSLLFEFAVLAVAAVIFVRRDF